MAHQANITAPQDNSSMAPAAGILLGDSVVA